MTSFGPPRRVVNDTKLGKHRTHERQAHGESYREAHTDSRFTSYTEKSLFVVKDYVFLEKPQSKLGANLSEAFHGIPDAPRYMWDTAGSLARRDNASKKKKQRTWLPNGGGIKPYNAPENSKPVAAEDCIIDVKAVKPKVDTWFRPKSIRSMSPEELTSSCRTKASSPRSPPRSPQRAATVVSTSKRARVEVPGTRRIFGNSWGNEEKRNDSAVKNLTSYWNDHLKRHPFTMSVPQKSQKSEDPNGRRDRGDDWRKKSQKAQTVHQQSRPKSVDSDGVVQEHTLVPSKILADKKMSSVEDIITFVRRSGTRGTSPASAKAGIRTHPRPVRCQEKPRKAPSLIEKPEICEHKPVSVPTPPPSPQIQPVRKTSSNDTSRKSRQHYHHRHPHFVVRLHTRWMLTFKVLTLTFRPLVEAWKRRWHNAATQDSAANETMTRKYELCQGDNTAVVSCRPAYYKNPNSSQKSSLKSKRKDTSLISRSSKIRKIKMVARRGMSDTLKFLPRTKRRKLVMEEVPKTSESCFAVTNQNVPLAKSCVSFLTGRKPAVERTPLVTEPVVSSSSGPVVVCDEAKSSTAKSASLEVLPRGLRMSLYVEYQLMISFIVVQSALFLIVLLIKWLQEYTA